MIINSETNYEWYRKINSRKMIDKLCTCELLTIDVGIALILFVRLYKTWVSSLFMKL